MKYAEIEEKMKKITAVQKNTEITNSCGKYKKL